MSLSVEKTNALIGYLKENEDVFEVLFFGISNETFLVKPKYYFQNYHKLMYQTHWLFENWSSNTKPVGIFNDSIVFMEEDGVMVEYCKGLQNLPYVLLAIRTLNEEEEIVNYSHFIKSEYGYFYNYFLDQYETWCKENDIVIDKSFGETYIDFAIGQNREVNPYYFNSDNLVFDDAESAEDIIVKTLTFVKSDNNK